jgi:hypothetical protein
MKTKTLIITLAVAALSSCSSARYASWFSPSMAEEEGIVLLGPVSEIYYLDNNNRESFSDSLSFLSEGLTEQLAYGLPLNIQGCAPLSAEGREEAAALLHAVDSWNDVFFHITPIPSALDSLIEASGARFGLLVYTEGMKRDMRGYAKEVVKGAFLGIVTAIISLGTVTYYSVPIASTAHIRVALLDGQEDRVVFYNRDTHEDENDPLDDRQMDRQLRRLLRNYLKKM